MGVHPAGAPTPGDSVRHALGLSGEKDQFLTHLSHPSLPENRSQRSPGTSEEYLQVPYRDLWGHVLRRRDGQEHVGEAMAAVAIVTIHPSITSLWIENR